MITFDVLIDVDENFQMHLNVFLNELERRRIIFLQHLKGTCTPDNVNINVINSKKYIKVYISGYLSKPGYGKYIHSFIDKSTGDILKPASSKAPAKGVRGNIFNNFGFDAFDSSYNIRYLR